MRHLEAKTVASVIVDLVRDLLLLLDNYRQSFESGIKNSSKHRQDLVKKIISSIQEVNVSGTVSAEKFDTRYV